MAGAATFINSANDAIDRITYTFSINLGAADLYSHIFVGVAGVAAVARTLDSVTVAGNAAAMRAQANNSNNHVEIWSLAYSAGGTQNIVCTWSGGIVRCAIVVWGV